MVALMAVMTKLSEGGFWAWLLWAGILSNTLERVFFGFATDMIPLPFELISANLKTVVANLADFYILISSIVILKRLR